MRKVSKTLAGIALIILVATLTFTGCRRQGGGGAAAGPQRYRVALLSKDNSDTFVRNIVDAAAAKANQLSEHLVLTVLDAENQIHRQIQQAEDMITQRFDAIILIPVDYEGSAPIVDMVLNAGITLVGINTTTPNMDRVTYVGSDDVDAGRIQAEWLRANLQPGSRIVYLEGPIGLSPQIFRRQGLWEHLINDPAMNINVLDAQTANWKRDEAMTLAENWITRFGADGIDAIVAQNDDMALGALEAVEARGLRDRILLIGVDAISDALLAVRAGRLDATVFQDAEGQGAGGVDAALELLRTGQQRMPDVWIPFVEVTQANVNQFM